MLSFYLLGMLTLFVALGFAILYSSCTHSQALPDLPIIFWLNTLPILATSYTYHRAYRSARLASPPNTLRWLYITLLLGTTFLALQAIGFLLLNKTVPYYKNIYAGYLYILAGLHALHLVAALGLLMLMLYRAIQHRISPAALHLLGLFWHALGVLWGLVLIFLSLLFG